MKHKDLPIKFFSGKDDPCAISPSDFGKAIHFMKDLGYTDVRGAMYKGMRHEILNEPRRVDVFTDVEQWFTECVVMNAVVRTREVSQPHNVEGKEGSAPVEEGAAAAESGASEN